MVSPVGLRYEESDLPFFGTAAVVYLDWEQPDRTNARSNIKNAMIFIVAFIPEGFRTLKVLLFDP